MTPQEAEAFQQRAAAEAAARAKWADGAQQIETDDLQYFSATEVTALANAGRLAHMGVGRDKRLRRR